MNNDLSCAGVSYRYFPSECHPPNPVHFRSIQIFEKVFPPISPHWMTFCKCWFTSFFSVSILARSLASPSATFLDWTFEPPLVYPYVSLGHQKARFLLEFHLPFPKEINPHNWLVISLLSCFFGEEITPRPFCSRLFFKNWVRVFPRSVPLPVLSVENPYYQGSAG